MAGSKLGGQRAATTNKRRYGDDFYKKLGSRGGAKGKADGVLKGFAVNKDLARRAGAIGGRISRRGKKDWSQLNPNKGLLDKLQKDMDK